MTISRYQSCPLCGQEAIFNFTYKPDGKRFHCPHCTEFWIDESSEAHLENMLKDTRDEFKQKLSLRAKKSRPDRLWVIRKPRADEAHGDGRRVARRMLIAEWVDLS